MLMKILFVISSLTCGGAEKVMSALTNEFVKAGFDIVIVKFDEEKSKPFFNIDPKIKLISLGLQNTSNGVIDALKWNFKRIKSLRQIVIQENPGVAISFLNRTNVLTILACQGTGLPVIISERNHPQYSNSNMFWRFLTRLAYRKCRFLVLQNKSFSNYYGYLAIDKIKIIPNPVSPVAAIGRPDLGEISSPAIVAIGKFEKQKGFDILIEAFDEVHQKRPNWKLYLFGSGSEFNRLAGLVSKLGLEKDVFLMGQTKSPAYYMSCAEIFVLSSRYEGFPNVLVEAMAVGAAPISTNSSDAISEIIDHGETGIIVEKNSKKDLSQAILLLIDDSKAREMYSKKARLIVERYPFDEVFRKWNDLISIFQSHI